MDFGNISTINLMKARLKYMSERQSVLAQNIANADTPGYVAKDIKEPAFGNMVTAASKKLPMMTTSGQHIATGKGSGSSIAAIKNKDTYELTPNGNNVVIEEEMMKVAENQQDYQKVLNLYRKSTEMFKIALGKPSGS